MTTLLEQYVYDAIKELTTIVQGHHKMTELANDLLRAVEILLEIKPTYGRPIGLVRAERESLSSGSTARSELPLVGTSGRPMRDDFNTVLDCTPSELTKEDKILKVRACLVITQKISAKQVIDRKYPPSLWGMMQHAANYVSDGLGTSQRAKFDAYLKLLFHTTRNNIGDEEVEHGIVIELQTKFLERKIADIELGEQTVKDEFLASMECYKALVDVYADNDCLFDLFKKSFLAGGDLTGSKSELLKEADLNLNAITTLVTTLRKKVSGERQEGSRTRYAEKFEAPEDKETVRRLYQLIVAAYLTEDAMIQKKHGITPRSLTDGLTMAFTVIDNMKDRFDPPKPSEGTLFLDIIVARLKQRCKQFQITHDIETVGAQNIEGWLQERINEIQRPTDIQEQLSKLSQGSRSSREIEEGSRVISLEVMRSTSQDKLRYEKLCAALKRGKNLRAEGGNAVSEHEAFSKFQAQLIEEVQLLYKLFEQYGLLELSPTENLVNPRVAIQLALIDYQVISSCYTKYHFSEPLPLLGWDVSGVRESFKSPKASADKLALTQSGLEIVDGLLERCLDPETKEAELEKLVESLQVMALKATLYANAKLCGDTRSILGFSASVGSFDTILRHGQKRMERRQTELHPEVQMQRRMVK